MTKFYARIENGVVVEVIDFNPEGRFEARLQWEECPAETRQGWVFRDGVVRDYTQAEKDEALSLSIRTRRDSEIEALRWRIERHNDELALELIPSEDIEPVLQYIQELREITEQSGFPNNLTWPVHLDKE